MKWQSKFLKEGWGGGGKKGCIPSHLFFDIFFDEILDWIKKERKGTWFWRGGGGGGG